MKRIIVLIFLLAIVVPVKARVNEWVAVSGFVLAGYCLPKAICLLKSTLRAMHDANQPAVNKDDNCSNTDSEICVEGFNDAVPK